MNKNKLGANPPSLNVVFRISSYIREAVFDQLKNTQLSEAYSYQTSHYMAFRSLFLSKHFLNGFQKPIPNTSHLPFTTSVGYGGY